MDADRVTEQKLIFRLKELARTIVDDVPGRALEQIIARSEAQLLEEEEPG